MDNENNVTQMPVKKPGPHRYQKGKEKLGGRKIGSGNKMPTLLKECIMMAAELEGMNQHGKDKLTGFLRHVAREDLRGFVMLLGKVLPYQMETRSDMKVEVVYHTVAEVRRELQSRGISVETVTRILHQEPKVVDHEGIEMIDDDDLIDVDINDGRPDDAA